MTIGLNRDYTQTKDPHPLSRVTVKAVAEAKKPKKKVSGKAKAKKIVESLEK